MEEARRIIRHDRDRVQRIWLVAQPGTTVIEVIT